MSAARRNAEAWEAFVTLCRVIAYACTFEIYVEHQGGLSPEGGWGKLPWASTPAACKCSFCTEYHEFMRVELFFLAARVRLGFIRERLLQP